MSIQLSSSLALAIALFSPPLSFAQVTVTVAAAADLSALQSDLSSQLEKTKPIRLRFVIGASAMLAQQIENGAPYDVFLSANAQFVDHLSSFGKIRPDSVRSYATGRVGVLWKDGKTHPLSELAENWVRFVALPNPRLAPYGVAAQQALEHARVWTAVSKKVVYGENVRQTLQLFDSGNADAVLTSDSLLQGRTAKLVPAEWHTPIVQKGGIVAQSQHSAEARQFLDWLVSPAGQAIFAKYGFGPPMP